MEKCNHCGKKVAQKNLMVSSDADLEGAVFCTEACRDESELFHLQDLIFNLVYTKTLSPVSGIERNMATAAIQKLMNRLSFEQLTAIYNELDALK